MKPLPAVVVLAALTPGCSSTTVPTPTWDPNLVSPEVVERAIASATHDFHAEGAPIEDRLEAPSSGSLTIQGKAWRCYVVTMRLGSGAAWGRGALVGLRFLRTTRTGIDDFYGRRFRPAPEPIGPGIIGPGGVASLGCLEADRPIGLRIVKRAEGPLGQGPFTMQVWVRTITAAEAAHFEHERRAASRCDQCVGLFGKEVSESRWQATRAIFENCVKGSDPKSCSECCSDQWGCMRMELVGTDADGQNCADLYR